MKSYLFIAFLMFFSTYNGQENVMKIKQINPSIEFENIHVEKISSNPSSSTFAIWIKKKVKVHKHINHTENILNDVSALAHFPSANTKRPVIDVS